MANAADDIAQLGFAVDTSPLVQAQQVAKQTAEALTKVGTAADDLGKKTTAAAPAVGKIGQQAEQVTQKSSQAARSLQDQAEKAQRLRQASDQVSNALRNFSGEISGVSGALGGGGGSAAGSALSAGLGAATRGATGLAGVLGPVGVVAAGVTVAIGALAAVTIGAAASLAEYEDRYATYESRLRNSLGSTEAARAALATLGEQAQANGALFEPTFDAFNRLSRSANDLGATNAQLLQLTNTVQKLGTISGATGGEIQSGLLQLSQALSSGKLNGDELRSVMENMPALAKAIADGLGRSVGELRSMGAAGELTGQKVFTALLSQTGKVDAEFAQMPNTVERSFNRITNNFSRMLANLATTLGASPFVQKLLALADKVVEAGADALTPETDAERLAKLNAQITERENQAAARINAANTSVRDRQQTVGNMVGVYKADRQPSETAAPASVDATLAELQAARDALTRKMAEDKERADRAAKDEFYRPEMGALQQGLTVANDVNDFAKERKGIEEQINTLLKAQQAADSLKKAFDLGPLDKQYAEFNEFAGASLGNTEKKSEALSQALTILRQKLEDAGDAFAKFNTSQKDFLQARQIGGMGGGLDIVKQAQDMQKALAKQGKASDLDTLIGAVLNDKGLRSADTAVADQTRTIERQQKLAKAILEGADATREAEVSTEALAWRQQMFGDLVKDDWIAVQQYAEGLRKLKAVQDEVAAARTISNTERATRQANAQAGAAGNASLLEQLRNQAEIENATAGIGDAKVRNSVATAMSSNQAAKSNLNRALSLANMERELSLQRDLFNVIGGTTEQQQLASAAIQKRYELQQQFPNLAADELEKMLGIADAIQRQSIATQRAQQDAEAYRAIWSGSADAIGQSLTDAFTHAFDSAQGKALSLSNLVTSIGTKVMNGVVTSTITNPLSRSLESFGTTAVAKVADWLKPASTGGMDSTDNVAAQMEKVAKASGEAAESLGTQVTQAASSTASGLLQQLTIGNSKASAEATATISINALSAAASTAAAALAAMGAGSAAGGGGDLLNGLFDYAEELGGGMGGDPGIMDGVGMIGFAKGGAFRSGRITAFADGGSFSNKVVSQPTLAPMALFGEAGDEAIMPLRRGANGSLGVVAAVPGGGGDGGLTITQNITFQINAEVGADTARIQDAMEKVIPRVKGEIANEIARGASQYTSRRRN